MNKQELELLEDFVMGLIQSFESMEIQSIRNSSQEELIHLFALDDSFTKMVPKMIAGYTKVYITTNGFKFKNSRKEYIRSIVNHEV